jgi:hypothetical protein
MKKDTQEGGQLDAEILKIVLDQPLPLHNTYGILAQPISM